MNYATKSAHLLARVSTDEQESNEAQITRLRDFAKSKGFGEFIPFEIAESSTKADRKKFQSVISKIIRKQGTQYLFVDTVDRLQRSHKETYQLDELRRSGKIEIFFYRENLHLHTGSNSSEIIRWEMGVMFARSYVLQLSDNVRRAFEQKRLCGEFTGNVPFGYTGIMADKVKRLRRDIVVNYETAPYVRRMYERYATGEHSVATLVDWLNGHRVRTNNGKKFTTTSVHQILRNPFYYGVVRSKYGSYPHIYEPIISDRLFHKVQSIRHSRGRKPATEKVKRDFIFRGLLKCKRCGCSMTAEVKKEKYIYYSCFNANGDCKRIFVNEEVLLELVRKILVKLSLTRAEIDEYLQMMSNDLESTSQFLRTKMRKLQAEHDQLNDDVPGYVEMRNRGDITQEEFVRQIDITREKIAKVSGEIADTKHAVKSYYVAAETVLNIVENAAEIFESSNTAEKRRMLNYLFSNCTLDGKKPEFTMRKPFETVFKMQECDDLCQRRSKNLPCGGVKVVHSGWMILAAV